MDEYIEKFTSLLVEYAPKALGAVLTIIIGFWLAKIIASKARKTMEKREIDASLIPFLTSLLLILIRILALLSAASLFGFEVTSFVAMLGALAFAVGLSLQGQLSHMAAGV